MHSNVETDLLTHEETIVVSIADFHIVVWNDDVNTFEWVIETLMEVCGHTHEQAEQCAYIIHYRGKYSVKNGDYNKLRPMCDAILDRGITASIEETV